MEAVRGSAGTAAAAETAAAAVAAALPLPLPADLCNSSRSACAMREVAWHSGIAQCHV